MKSVIASLKPYYYYLVGEGIKKIEVRKNFPKDEYWSKEVLFYMSKDEKSFAKIPKEFQAKYRKHFGKVGLKFTCAGIMRPFSSLKLMSKESCVSIDNLLEYSNGKTLYGWRISDFEIYDIPKELSEFKNLKGEIIKRPPQSWQFIEV